MHKIYLDHNATTPLDPIVKGKLIELMDEPFNPSSQHYFGQKAKRALIAYREKIAQFLNVSEEEIIFTCGGTDSMNMLILGLTKPHHHIITTKLEHSCVYETIKSMPNEVSYVPCNKSGAPQVEDIKAYIKPNSVIILSAVNSETGALLEIDAIAQLSEATDSLFILDGVAMLGKMPVKIPSGITAIGFSGHKIHALKGSGFAYIHYLADFQKPYMFGGPQEKGFRGGTENLLGIASIAFAIELIAKNQETYTRHMQTLRDHFEEKLLLHLDGVNIHAKQQRTCNVSNLSFLGVDAESLLILLDQNSIAVSHGSACSSGALEPSRVLLEMGLTIQEAKSSIRVSFSKMNTLEEVNRAADVILASVKHLRSFTRATV